MCLKIVLTFALLLSVAPSDAGQPEYHRLENGLRVVIVPDSSAEDVTVQTWFHVGSADDGERRGLCGLATEALSGDRPSKLLCVKRRDTCYFWDECNSVELETTLAHHAGTMKRQTVDQDALANACRWLNWCGDDLVGRPGEKLGSPFPLGLGPFKRRIVLLREMFGEHPYAFPPELVTAWAQTVTTDDVEAYRDRWFVPANATLFVMGDVQPPAVMEAVRRHFGLISWAPKPRREAHALPGVEVVRPPAVEASLSCVDIAWLTPPAGDRSNVAIDVLLQHLCNPVDGPLCKRLAELGCPPPTWGREAWRQCGMVTLTVRVGSDDGGGDGECGRTNADDEETLPQPLPGREGSKIRREVERVVMEEVRAATRRTPSEVAFDRARALAVREVRWGVPRQPFREADVAEAEMLAGDMLVATAAAPRRLGLHVGELRRAAALLRDARTVVLQCHDDGKEPPWYCRSATIAAFPEPGGRLAGTHSGAEGTVIALPNSVWIRVRHDADRSVTLRTYAAIPGESRHTLPSLLRVGSTDWSVDHFREYVTLHGLDLGLTPRRDRLESTGLVSQIPQMMELHAKLYRRPNDTELACLVAARRTSILRRAVAAGWSSAYVPPGAIGWRPMDRILEDEHSIRASLAPLRSISRIEIEVIGPVEPDEVRRAVEAVWDDWRPTAGGGFEKD